MMMRVAVGVRTVFDCSSRVIIGAKAEVGTALVMSKPQCKQGAT